MQQAPRLMKEWREENGATQMAAAALVGVRQATWCEWEGGKKSPRIELALKLAEVTKGKVPVEAWTVTESDPAPESGRAGEEPNGSAA